MYARCCIFTGWIGRRDKTTTTTTTTNDRSCLHFSVLSVCDDFGKHQTIRHDWLTDCLRSLDDSSDHSGRECLRSWVQESGLNGKPSSFSLLLLSVDRAFISVCVDQRDERRWHSKVTVLTVFQMRSRASRGEIEAKRNRYETKRAMAAAAAAAAVHQWGVPPLYNYPCLSILYLSISLSFKIHTHTYERDSREFR